MEIVSFVVLHYKDLDVTDICVRSILKMNHQDKIRIVVVDNDINECDEKREQLTQRYRRVHNITVLQIKENGGFSYANNIGYQYAREQLGASCIVVLNNDIEFIQKDFIDRLEKIENIGKYYVVGPDVVRQSTGEHQNPMDTNLRSKDEVKNTIRNNQFALKYYDIMYPFLMAMFRYQEKKNAIKRKHHLDYFKEFQEEVILFGACLIFMPCFVHKEVKAFFPETPFYYEEYILGKRCKDNNYNVLYCPELIVKHESGSATKKNFSQEKNRLKFVMEMTLKSSSIYCDML